MLFSCDLTQVVEVKACSPYSHSRLSVFPVQRALPKRRRGSTVLRRVPVAGAAVTYARCDLVFPALETKLLSKVLATV